MRARPGNIGDRYYFLRFGGAHGQSMRGRIQGFRVDRVTPQIDRTLVIAPGQRNHSGRAGDQEIAGANSSEVPITVGHQPSLVGRIQEIEIAVAVVQLAVEYRVVYVISDTHPQ